VVGGWVGRARVGRGCHPPGGGVGGLGGVVGDFVPTCVVFHPPAPGASGFGSVLFCCLSGLSCLLVRVWLCDPHPPSHVGGVAQRGGLHSTTGGRVGGVRGGGWVLRADPWRVGGGWGGGAGVGGGAVGWQGRRSRCSFTGEPHRTTEAHARPLSIALWIRSRPSVKSAWMASTSPCRSADGHGRAARHGQLRRRQASRDRGTRASPARRPASRPRRYRGDARGRRSWGPERPCGGP